jgi:hypothetical protein
LNVIWSFSTHVLPAPSTASVRLSMPAKVLRSQSMPPNAKKPGLIE